MDRRKRRLFIGGLVVVVAVVAGLRWVSAASERAFEDELKLARQDGLPTTPAEFAALVPPAAEDQNAAKFYRLVSVTLPPRVDELAERLIHAPLPTDAADAQRFITAEAASLKLIEQGTRLAQCNFERDWERLVELEMPEYRQLLSAATLLRTRGTLRMRAGQHALALGADPPTGPTPRT